MKRPRGARNHVAEETTRPDTSGDRYFRSTSQSPIYVSDAHTHTQFLVDTGSEVSAIPPTPADRSCSPDPLTLMAVNHTPIRTYGKRSFTLNLGLRRSLPWIFTIVDVKKPILGAKFLRHFGLLVDMSARKLIDSHTHLQVQGILSSDVSPSPSICPKDNTNPYLNLPAEFPALTQISTPDTPVKHDITHHIKTTGPPVAACPQRLATDRLKAAKREFEHHASVGHRLSLLQCLVLTPPHGSEEDPQ